MKISLTEKVGRIANIFSFAKGASALPTGYLVHMFTQETISEDDEILMAEYINWASNKYPNADVRDLWNLN